MGTIWVKEFTGGLDTRRLFEASEPNILVRARNGHINRGGEFEKRLAFVPEYELPAGTVGLARTPDSLYVFGHQSEPSGIPTGVTYQRLQHPDDSSTELVRITSAELFKGNLYVAAEFEDGTIHHFFDGDAVTDWYDGRSRASFEVTGGENTPGAAASGSLQVTGGSDTPTAAEGSFTVAGGTSGVGNEITAVTIDGVDVLGAAVPHTGDNSTTADDAAAQINSHTSSPDYTASASGTTVTITAAAPGADANGREITVGVDGDVTVGTTQDMAGGTDAGVITAVRVDGVNLISGSVAYDTDNTTTAAAIASAINTHTSTPNYTATASAGRVEITAAAVGTQANGRPISTTLTGEVETDNLTSLSGGQNAYISEVTDIKVAGVSIMTGSVQWGASDTDTAEAIATAINGFTSTPNYEATTAGPQVVIIAVDPGEAPNGRAVDVVRKNGLTISPSSGLKMADGADSDDAYQPGPFVKTVGSKMYALSGSVMHFSGIQQPDQWDPDTVGAGFIDLASESSDMERLMALARYQEYVAVFAESGIQIWYIDPDPELYRLAQSLNNTGTLSPRSVTQFGDEDVFYLDESGLRSLRSRAALNVAVTTDVGVPVDGLIQEKIAGMNTAQRNAVTGLIEPATGRFWLIAGDCVFVFTFFQSANVSAWSTYDTTDPDGEAFTVEYALVHDRRVFLRAGDTIYAYGGPDGATYDESEAEVWLPYLDADKPTAKKSWDGLDAACLGQWEVWAAMHPTTAGIETEEMIGQVWQTTYNDNRIPMHHDSTHASLRFRSVGDGAHKLSAVVLHYQETGRED